MAHSGVKGSHRIVYHPVMSYTPKKRLLPSLTIAKMWKAPKCPSTEKWMKKMCYILKESFPRQVDKKSRGPQGERGLEFSRRKKGQTFFLLYIP